MCSKTREIGPWDRKTEKIHSFKYIGVMWSIGNKDLTQKLKEPQSFVRDKFKAGGFHYILRFGDEVKTAIKTWELGLCLQRIAA